jgi:hypothetical protein
MVVDRRNVDPCAFCDGPDRRALKASFGEDFTGSVQDFVAGIFLVNLRRDIFPFTNGHGTL